MLHPSYTDLIKIVNEEAEGDTPVINSRYTIVMATAKRARQIISDPAEKSWQNLKPLSQAVKELSEGSLHINPENPEEDEVMPGDVPSGDGELILEEAEEAAEGETVPETAGEADDGGNDTAVTDTDVM